MRLQENKIYPTFLTANGSPQKKPEHELAARVLKLITKNVFAILLHPLFEHLLRVTAAEEAAGQDGGLV